jgi:prepilin-type N-terminal cleavage/methylation domain-containing protein
MRTTHMNTRQAGQPRGFTLIELLAVLVIIGVLVTALISGGIFGFLTKGEESMTRKTMTEIQIKLDEIGRELGTYPSGNWEKFHAFVKAYRKKLRGVDIDRMQGGSEVNSGSEILVLLFEAYGLKPGVDEDFIGDTDEDGFLEYLDAWGNPLVYICNITDDGAAQVLAPIEGGGHEPILVQPLPSKQHKNRARGEYQILSGGPDGTYLEQDLIEVVRD